MIKEGSTNSWGNLYHGKQSVFAPHWRDEVLHDSSSTILAIGNRRSYGDVGVNMDQGVIDMMGLKRFISFDRESGVVCCEAGVTLREIADVTIPAGWFLPVTPGTSFASIGGAVANDVHGKNHHVVGSFGCHVRALELQRSSGELLICSQQQNTELFTATIGGCGLTGTIVWVELSLKRITNTTLNVESISYDSFEEFLRLSSESETSHEYCVSWTDCLARGSNVGRGVFFRANHVGREASYGTPGCIHTDWWQHKGRSVPALIGKGFPLINPLSLRAFNALYTRVHAGTKSYVETFQKYFYPLDSLSNWNRIYGRRGFYQFQCVVSFANQSAIADILNHISTSGQGSFLSVLKTMGDTRSPGLMSFCRPGVTLALDFPNGGRKTLNLLSELECIVVEAGGAIYPAKDAVMTADTFRKCFPAIDEFKTHIDVAYSSDFWRRVGGD